MEAWQERVVQERDQLRERMSKLEQFLDTGTARLDADDVRLLEAQLAAMGIYHGILIARIGRF